MGDVLDSLSIGGQEVDPRVLEVGVCDRVGPDAAREGWRMIHRVMTDELRQYLEYSLPELATEAIRCFVTEMPKSELSSLAASC